MVKIQMYIPKYPMHPYLRLREALAEVSGYTEHCMCAGSWKDGSGGIIEEGVVVIEMIAEQEDVPRINRCLMDYKVDAEQESVLYTVSEVQAFFI